MLRLFVLTIFFFSHFAFSQQICQDSSACNYAYEADCIYPEQFYDCNNVCLSDIDNDNICDELEIFGCTDGIYTDGNPMACNYNPIATEDDGSCIYPGLIFDCDGITCLNDIDGDGICDANEIDGCDDIEAYNYDPIATEDDGSCWYPIYGCLEPMAGNYNPYAELDDNSCLFPPWQYSSTDCNMTILIPEEINISIDEEPISYGDWIGAFYQNLNGDVICGGAVMWKEETTSIALWGAEGDQFNGFLENQDIIWKTFSNNEERILIPSYSFGENSYSCNALGGLDDLFIYSQQIYLPPGWSIFSTYISPINNNLEKLFELTDEVVIIKNEMGDVFWPSLGINQIGSLSYDEGYIIKMDYYGDGHNLYLEGSIIPSNVELVFEEGWSIISYLNPSPSSVEETFSTIEDQLIIIKDEDGLIWWPSFGVNSMEMMYPGKGYQIKMLEQSTFSYDQNLFRFSNLNKSSFIYYNEVKSTGNNMTLGIKKDSWLGFSPEIGDEIAVFSKDGLLVGSQVYDGDNVAITLWGDDLSTFEIDGLNVGEQFLLKIWSKNQNKEYNLNVISFLEGSNFFSNNGISIINSITLEKIINNNDSYYVKDLLGRDLKNPNNENIFIKFYKNGSVKLAGFVN